MKAQRRHELKENDLSHILHERWQYISRHANQVLGVTVIAIIVFGVIAWSQVVSRQAESDDWQDYYNLRAQSSDEANLLAATQQLVDRASAPDVVRLSLVLLARVAWEQAMTDLTPDEAKLEQAEKANQRVLDEFSNDAYAVGTAYCGLAAIAEVRKDAEKARSYYEKILADSRLEYAPVHAVAEARLADLDERLVEIRLADSPAPAPEAPQVTPRATSSQQAAVQRAAASQRAAMIGAATQRTGKQRAATTQPAATQPAAAQPAPK